jgi:hypothetical protein
MEDLSSQVDGVSLAGDKREFELDPNEPGWEDLAVDRLNTLTEENGLFPHSGIYKSVIVEYKGKRYKCKIRDANFDEDGAAVTFTAADVVSVHEARASDQDEFIPTGY